MTDMTELNTRPQADATPIRSNKLTRREFLKTVGAIVGSAAMFPVLTPDVDPLRGQKVENLREFKDVTEATNYLESQSGSQWIKGGAVSQLESMPWQNSQAWTNFRNLETIGTSSHFVYLVPKSDGTSYSVLGLEPGQGKTIIDFIDNSGKSQAIKIMTPVSLKSLIKKDYETLSVYSVQVGPDLEMKPDTKIYTRTPVVGVVDGFVASTDGTRYHYFQGSLRNQA